MDQQASEQTKAIESWVQRLKEGDAEAREQLLQLASDRLRHLTRRIKKDFARIARWEETDDIFQQAVLRLYTAMESVELQSATHFLRLAAQQIRRQLIDLSRSYYGPQGAARHHASQAGFGDDNESPGHHAFEAAEVSQDPQKMQEWSEFHQLIEELLDQWEEALERGQKLAVEELCRDCPEHIAALESKIQALMQMDARMSGKWDDASSTAETLSVKSEISQLMFHAKGGLGAVYRATESELNREVAVKFIHRNLVSNAESCERFSLEAEVTGRLEHPGVVPLYGLGRTDHGRLFYYMRYIDGETLDDAIIRFHRTRPKRGAMGIHSVDFRQLLTSFASVCRTIAYAHNRGIVHRDIKPANVMLGKYGETIVVDWGLAVPVTRDDRFRQSGEASLMPTSGSGSGTASGAGIGTPAYMSPKQMSGLSPAPASDIYSLGATLFKMLTGQPAFFGDNIQKLKQNVLEGKIPRPRNQQSGVSEELEAVCLKAMSL